jgi:DNA-binding NtrC family response regulator/serine/threonine protein kinase
MKARILVVDDESVACEELCEALVREGYEACGFGDGETALAAAGQQSFDVCISDIRMPGMSGFELLRRLHDTSPKTLVFLVTAYGDMEGAIVALQEGASDYLLKPLSIDELLRKLDGVIQSRNLVLQVRQRRLAQQVSFGLSLQGSSAYMLSARRRIVEVASNRCHLLVVGERGTGCKEVPRVVHDAAAEDGPFLTLDCKKPDLEGPEDPRSWEALLRSAARGTLFLSEVEMLTTSHQSALLRAIHAQAETAKRDQVSPTRIVATGNESLESEVAAGYFLDELYQTLCEECIVLPALRRRREDVPVVVEHLLERAHLKTGGPLLGVTHHALAYLLGYPWPGNTAELVAAIESALERFQQDATSADPPKGRPASDRTPADTTSWNDTSPGGDIQLAHLPAPIQSAAPLWPADLLPSHIGPYRVDGHLGSGGMGTVYRAYDQKLDRKVAIKQVSAGQDAEQRARLRREARTIAKLKHPAIVEVYQLLEEDGLDYIVMELIEGESLAQRIEGGPLELIQALTLACEIVAGLGDAHRHGVVHRDLKAGNVILTSDDHPTPGRVKILDFGIAKPIPAGDEDTVTDVTVGIKLLGTAHAMSPEQIASDELDQRSDLFSLGTLLYEMTTGQRPFSGPGAMQVMFQVCTKRQPPAKQIADHIPDELSALIDALLEKDPERRPQQTDEVNAALERILTTLAAAPEESRTGPIPDLSSNSPTANVPLWRRLLRLFGGRPTRDG